MNHTIRTAIEAADVLRMNGNIKCHVEIHENNDVRVMLGEGLSEEQQTERVVGTLQECDFKVGVDLSDDVNLICLYGGSWAIVGFKVNSAQSR